MPTNRTALAAATVALPMLAGCAAIPRLGPAPAPIAAAQVAAGQSLAGVPGARWPGDRWWADYGDAQLDALIEEGLRRSPDVAVAAARLRRADALAREQRGALLPTLDVSGQAGVQKQSYNQGIPEDFLPHGWQDVGRIEADLGFDLDLWGGRRAALVAARGETEASAIDARQAALMLTTAIADAYADLARLHALRDIARRTVALREQTGRLVRDREAAGLETRGSLRQADANVATARADLAAADEAIALRGNQIAALAGVGPDRALAIGRPALAILAPRDLPAEASTDLIGRRPDVAAALIRTTAAASRIKAARADFYPSVRLSALVGLQSLGLGQLVDAGSTFGTAGPAISLPIFHGGAISARYRGARAAYDEAVADYDGRVLAAYREVADAVTSRRSLRARLDNSQAALAASEQAYSIARQRYEGGLSTFLDVLEVEDRLLAARRAKADLDARAFALDVALVRALGGGFRNAGAPRAKEPTDG